MPPAGRVAIAQTKDFSFCLVDEADSILIDEARTPLIISRSVDAPAQKFATAQKIANVLEKGLHYTVGFDQLLFLCDLFVLTSCPRIAIKRSTLRAAGDQQLLPYSNKSNFLPAGARQSL